MSNRKRDQIDKALMTRRFLAQPFAHCGGPTYENPFFPAKKTRCLSQHCHLRGNNPNNVSVISVRREKNGIRLLQECSNRFRVVITWNRPISVINKARIDKAICSYRCTRSTLMNSLCGQLIPIKSRFRGLDPYQSQKNQALTGVEIQVM